MPIIEQELQKENNTTFYKNTVTLDIAVLELLFA